MSDHFELYQNAFELTLCIQALFVLVEADWVMESYKKSCLYVLYILTIVHVYFFDCSELKNASLHARAFS